MKEKNIQLIIGFITLLFMGVVYSWSLFVEPLELEFGWSRDQTSLAFSLSIIFFCIGNLLTGALYKIISHRVLTLIATMLFLIGFMGCAHISFLWNLYVFYSVFCGLGIGIIYNLMITLASLWFPDKIGFSTGLLLMGYGMGSAFLGVIISVFNETYGWRQTYYIFACIFSALLVIVAVFSKKPKNKKNEKETITYKFVRFETDISTRKMIRTGNFYLYYIWVICISTIGLSVIGHAYMIAVEQGAGIKLGVFLAGLVSITNGASRVLFGVVYDEFGRKRTMYFVSILVFLGTIFLFLSIKYKSCVILTVAFSLIGIGYGGHAPCNSSFTRQFFGSKFYSSNFAVITTNGIFAAIMGTYVVGKLVNYSEGYNSTGIYLIICALLALGLQIILSAKEKN